jgi:hypothetical protein
MEIGWANGNFALPLFWVDSVILDEERLKCRESLLGT